MSEPGKPLTKAQEMSAGLGAGIVSAMWGTPLELIMIQQQRKGGSTPSTVKVSNQQTAKQSLRNTARVSKQRRQWPTESAAGTDIAS